jgi:hypothetical protein
MGGQGLRFFMSGCAYLLALGIIQLLAPRIEPVKFR